ITVNATRNDSPGLSSTSSATVNVEAPPPPPPPPAQANKLSSCDFPNPVKPWRVDNTCKAVLDDVAQRLQHDPETKLVIVGNQTPTEKRRNLAAERAVDSKAYLSGGEAKQAIDASRIEVRTGNGGTKTADYWKVPLSLWPIAHTSAEGLSHIMNFPKLARKLLIPVIFTLICAAAAWAGQWTVLGPDGGDVRSLAYNPHNPDQIFLGTNTGVIFV